MELLVAAICGVIKLLARQVRAEWLAFKGAYVSWARHLDARTYASEHEALRAKTTPMSGRETVLG